MIHTVGVLSIDLLVTLCTKNLYTIMHWEHLQASPALKTEHILQPQALHLVQQNTHICNKGVSCLPTYIHPITLRHRQLSLRRWQKLAHEPRVKTSC